MIDLILERRITAQRWQRIRAGCLENDIAYFAEHPHARYRIRPIVPGELGKRRPKADRVVLAVHFGDGAIARCVCRVDQLDRVLPTFDALFARFDGDLLARAAALLRHNQSQGVTE